MVKQIAQLHGGSVSAESAPGQGSTFTVKIPKI
jgi:signal transduction histidine kinase